ncbi:NAD(P)-binding protein [Candidatus Poribacteria bacterium]|nr:NAD(P)-binding protein [Candidatus Poribacteria bacterium]
MDEIYDFVVIGAGFGGSITACRLAQGGKSVCILEQGRRWKNDEFPRTTGQFRKGLWDPKETYGFIQYRAFKRLDVIQGCGVGGGSLVYFNVHLRPPDEIFNQSSWPENISLNTMEPYYSLVKDMLDAVPLTPPKGYELPPKTEAFFDAAEGAGKETKLVDIAVYTGPDRNAPHGDRTQSACTYSGNCLIGCNVYAKNTLDLNYIPLAEENGAQIYPLHMVYKISQEPDEGYRVYARRLDEEQHGQWEEVSFVGKQVIIAAGTLGSTELLLRCRDEYNTLSNISQKLGECFSINGEMIFAGTLFEDREVEPGYGPSITSYADCSTANNKIIIEDLGFPTPLLWYLEGILPSDTRLSRLARFLKIYLLQSIGIRNRSSRFSEELDAITSGERTTRFLPYLGLGTDASDGILYLRDGSIDIRWSHRGSRLMYKELVQAMKALSKAANGKYFASPLWRWPLRKLLVAHPLGGCIMGNSSQDSVVNHNGEVWNYPGLYVADGSVIPSALSVNPSMTIGAIGERTAFWILHNREMQLDDSETPQKN